MLATEASTRRRTWAGLAGFAAIEIATFVRYTDIVILGCAVVAVILAWRLQPARLPLRTLCWWLASVLVFGAGVAIFDAQIYGGPLTTGYQPGEVTFGLGAVGPNLRIMPGHLIHALPMLVLGLVAFGWIIVRGLVLRRVGGRDGAVARRDLWVGLAVGASWFAIWGLYSAYTWTTDPTSVTVQVVRFYVPALGAIALLGAWLVTRVPGRASRAGLTSAAVITAMFGLGVWSFYAMYAAFGVPVR
jgi:energy-coupling factor transporter transmembrane protein EcfT